MSRVFKRSPYSLFRDRVHCGLSEGGIAMEGSKLN